MEDFSLLMGLNHVLDCTVLQAVWKRRGKCANINYFRQIKAGQVCRYVFVLETVLCVGISDSDNVNTC